jgi:hypothetical protein
MNVPFDEADLAGIVLNLVPSSWVNQYNMTHSTLPKNLLNNLEAIEQVMDEKHIASLKAKAKEASSASAATKGSSKKRSASGGFSELQVPKKARPSKFCQHPALQGKGRAPSDSQYGMTQWGIPFLCSRLSPLK